MADTGRPDAVVAGTVAGLAAGLRMHEAGSGNGDVSESPVRVLIAEDHPVYLQGLREVIRARPDFALVAAGTDGRSALARYGSSRRMSPCSM